MRISEFVVASLVLVIIASIGFGSISMAHSYQYTWRINFAEKHLEIATGVTDAESQYNEISKTIEILDTFPKQGNYLIYNKYYPTTDMETAWSALYQLKNYTNEIKYLDKASSTYQIGIYNSQEKILYFKTTLWEAYPTFVYWGAYGWLMDLSAYLGIIGFSFSLFVLLSDSLRKNISKNKIIILLLMNCWLAMVGIIFYIILNIPVFYRGPI